MLFFPKARFHRAAAAEAAERLPANGAITDVSLSDVRCLCLPPQPGFGGVMRPPLDYTALKLSLELAYLTYTLNLAPWRQAGWTDISIQVDDRVLSGVAESEKAGSEQIRRLINAFKVARAKQEMKERNPLAQMMGALRQREKSDTIKAVTLLHPAGVGHYVVAIGFMGTGSRFYDWFSNFRFDTVSGFHKGFFQLTSFFEQNAEHIRFPSTAAALGLQRLTLADVLEEMTSPDSRFTLWMAGHSQGAAVMQVFCHRLLTGWGVLPQHIIGYGFASPTVAAAASVRDPADYPLYHLMNSDDMVPLVGALYHLGVGLVYQADDTLRAATYGWTREPTELEQRGIANTLLRHVKDTPTMLEALAALLETINEEKTEESITALMNKPWSIAPLDKAFSFAGGKAITTLDRSVRYLKVAYRSLMGCRMDATMVATLKEEMRPIVRAMPLRTLMNIMANRLHPPHRLRRSQNQPGAYSYIVLSGSARLRAFTWRTDSGRFPYRADTAGYALFVRHGVHRSYLSHSPARRNPRTRSISALRGGSSSQKVLHSISFPMQGPSDVNRR